MQRSTAAIDPLWRKADNLNSPSPCTCTPTLSSPDASSSVRCSGVTTSEIKARTCAAVSCCSDIGTVVPWILNWTGAPLDKYTSEAWRCTIRRSTFSMLPDIARGDAAAVRGGQERSSSLMLVLARVCASTFLTITAQYRLYLPSAEGRLPLTTTEPAGTRP